MEAFKEVLDNICKGAYSKLTQLVLTFSALIIPGYFMIFVFKREVFNSMDFLKLILLIISINLVGVISIVVFLRITVKGLLMRISEAIIIKRIIINKDKDYIKLDQYIKSCKEYLEKDEFGSNVIGVSLFMYLFLGTVSVGGSYIRAISSEGTFKLSFNDFILWLIDQVYKCSILFIIIVGILIIIKILTTVTMWYIKRGKPRFKSLCKLLSQRR